MVPVPVLHAREAFEAVCDNPQAKLSTVFNYTANSVVKAMMIYTTSWDTIQRLASCCSAMHTATLSVTNSSQL